MSQIKIENVTKKYRKSRENQKAVEKLSVDINDNEFIVIVGPSGCGKTTILRMVAGLESITKGKISLDGQEIHLLPPSRRSVAMVFQDYALYPGMTAKDNIGYGLKHSTNLSKKEINDKVEKSAGRLGIGNLLMKYPKQLSGGQQQRVALGRAIVRDPDVFLMDEPLANLDAKLRSQMRSEIQRIQKDLGTTTVYVTHDQKEAMTMGDRIVVLKDGVLQQIGTPTQVYNRPANEFVASFLGRPGMNIYNAKVKENKKKLLIKHDSEELATIQINKNKRETSFPDELNVGIRPKDINISQKTLGENLIAKIESFEYQGNETHLRLSSNGINMLACVEGDYRFDINDEVDVQFPNSKIHIFNSETGERTLTL